MKFGLFRTQDPGPRTQRHPRRFLPPSLPSPLLHSSLRRFPASFLPSPLLLSYLRRFLASFWPSPLLLSSLRRFLAFSLPSPLLLSSLRPLDSGGALPDFIRQAAPDRGRKNPACAAGGFTLFELLAVLTVISIIMALVVGSYGSWGTAHALTGATRVVEAGLNQARAIAVTRRAYVAFTYGSTNRPSFVTSVTTGFQSFICTNTVPPVDETVLKKLVEHVDNNIFVPSDGYEYTGANPLILEPATPFQRLSGHIRLRRRETPDSGEHTTSLLVFRPDGSIVTDDGITLPEYLYHTIAIQTAESFSDPDSATPTPLVRLLRIDPATGLATVLGGAR